MNWFSTSVILVILVVLATVTGCASGDNLIFVTYTKVGVDVSGVQQTPTDATFGYRRFEGAIIPVDRSEVGTVSVGSGQMPKDAASVFAQILLKNGWISGVTVSQVFATGDAAVEAAKDPQGQLTQLANQASQTLQKK